MLRGKFRYATFNSRVCSPSLYIPPKWLFKVGANRCKIFCRMNCGKEEVQLSFFQRKLLERNGQCLERGEQEYQSHPDAIRYAIVESEESFVGLFARFLSIFLLF